MPHSGQALSTLAEAASLMNHTQHPTHGGVPGIVVPQPHVGEPAVPVPTVHSQVGAPLPPPPLAPPPATGNQEEMVTIRHFMDSSLDCPKAYDDVKRLTCGTRSLKCGRNCFCTRGRATPRYGQGRESCAGTPTIVVYITDSTQSVMPGWLNDIQDIGSGGV
jgi:hypothetical protein